MPNWAELLLKLAEDAKKPIAEGLASVEGVLSPERLAEIQTELAKMRLLRRRGEHLGDRIARTPIIPAAGAATVAGVGASQPDEAEAAITPGAALNATRSLDRQALEILAAKVMAKMGGVTLGGDEAMNLSRSVRASIHGRPSHAQDTWNIMKKYAEDMGTKAIKTTDTVAPSENVFTGPNVLGHYNYEKGGASSPLNLQSVTHEIPGHGKTSDLALKLNIPGRVLPKDQPAPVREMLNDLFPGKNADDLKARILGNLSAYKDPAEKAEGFLRSGADVQGSELIAHAQSWKAMKDKYGSVEAADKVFDINPLVQKIEDMAKKDPALQYAWDMYKGIAVIRQGAKANLRQGAKAIVPALGVGAGVEAMQAQEQPQDDYGFKPVAAAPPQEDFGFKPVQATEVKEDYGFKPVSGEITAKVGEPSEETINQIMQTQTEQGIPIPSEGVGTKKFGTPEGISREKGTGEQWRDLLGKTFKYGAEPGMERLEAMMKLVFAVPENVGRKVVGSVAAPLLEHPEGGELLKPGEGRTTTGSGVANFAGDILGTSLPVGRGAKFLLGLAKEAKAAKLAKTAEGLGIKNLEQMFADTREAAAGTRYIPKIANPEVRKFTREEVEQTLANLQKKQGGLKITDTRVAPPAARPEMPGGPQRLTLGEVYEGLKEGWNEPADAARRALSQEQLGAAATTEDVKAIANLASTKEPDTAKWWKSIGAKYIRSLDNWLMDNGGRAVVEPIRKAVYAGDAWRTEWAHKADAIFKTVGVKEGSREAEIIGRYLNGELTAPGLTPELRTAGDRLRSEILEPVIKQVRADPELAELLGPIGYIKDYFPQMEKVWRSRYGEENALALIHDVKPERFKARFFKKRQDLAKDPLLDAVTVTRAYLRGSSKTLFDIKGYNAAVEALKGLPAGPGQLFREAASKYAKTFIGQPSTRDDITAAEKVLNKVHDFYYKAYIGYNPVSAGLNLSQTANTFVAVGGKYTSQALKEVFKRNKVMEEKFVQSGAMTEFRGMEISPSLEKSKGKMDESMFYLFGQAERLNRKIAFIAGYKEAAAKGLSEEARIKHALDVIHRTQFTYGTSSKVGYAGIPLIGQFSNYPLKQAEFMLKSIKDPASRKRAFAMLIMAAGASGTPMGKALVEQASDLAPGIGPGAKDLLVLPAQMVYQGRLPSLYDIGRRIPRIGPIPVSGALRTGKFVFKDIPEWLETVGRGLAPEAKKKK